MTDVLPDSASTLGAHVRDRLAIERVIWLTTVGADGTPQPNPVWFLWREPNTFLVYNRSDARRLEHIANQPRIAMHFDGNGQGGDIVVFTGTAALAPDESAAHEHPRYVAKYGDAMEGISGSTVKFAAEYPVALQITIERFRGH